MVQGLRLRATPGVLAQLLLLALALNVIFVLPRITPAEAAPADIFVVDLDAGDVSSRPGKVFRLDSAGSRTGEFSATSFVEPSGIAFDSKSGTVLVADPQAFGASPIVDGPGGVIRLNVVSGAATTVSSGNLFLEPTGVAIAPNGVDLYVVDQDAFGGGCDDSEPGETKIGCGGVIRVDAAGNQTRIASGDPFWNPTGIAVAPDGSIIVADLDAGGGGGQIFRVSPDGSSVTAIATGPGPAFVEPSGVAVAPNGQIFVVDAVAFADAGGVIRVNPDGSKTTVSSGNLFLEPTGIAVAFDGDLLVADQDAFGGPETGPGGIIKVNPVTGTQTRLQAGAPFVAPTGVAVEPGSPPGGPGPGPGPSPTPLFCGGRQATLSGTAGKDTLKGSPVRDVILGLGGNDTVKALGGHDRVCGGTGKDKVSGGKGKDRLNGEAGNDKLIGGPGADRLVGGKGRDTCIGGPGKDKYVGCEIKVETP